MSAETVHKELDAWVNSLPPSFMIDDEARVFIETMKERDPEAWAAWLEAVSVKLVADHMRSKIGLRRRDGRRAGILADALKGRAPESVGASAIFARSHLSVQKGDGTYAELRTLTKLDLLRVANRHATMIKGHMKAQTLYQRLADALPSDDAVLCDYLTDEQIAEVAAQVEAAA